MMASFKPTFAPDGRRAHDPDQSGRGDRLVDISRSAPVARGRRFRAGSGALRPAVAALA